LSLSNTHDIQLYIICFDNQGYYLDITEDSGRDNQDTINFLHSRRSRTSKQAKVS
jgi:hypothetical protein